MSLLQNQPGSLHKMPLAFERRDTSENSDADFFRLHTKAFSQLIHVVSEWAASSVEQGCR